MARTERAAKVKAAFPEVDWAGVAREVARACPFRRGVRRAVMDALPAALEAARTPADLFADGLAGEPPEARWAALCALATRPARAARTVLDRLALREGATRVVEGDLEVKGALTLAPQSVLVVLGHLSVRGPLRGDLLDYSLLAARSLDAPALVTGGEVLVLETARVGQAWLSGNDHVVAARRLEADLLVEDDRSLEVGEVEAGRRWKEVGTAARKAEVAQAFELPEATAEAFAAKLAQPPGAPPKKPKARPAPAATAEELYEAVCERDLPRVKAALAGGAPVDSDEGEAAFEVAVEHGFEAIVRALVEAGAEPSQGLLAAGGAPKTLKLLLSLGARPDTVPALHRAQSPAVVAALLSAGAKLEARDDLDRTPLHAAAAEADDPKVLTALVEAGADLTAQDGEGRTALHLAAERGYLAAVRPLLKRGAQANAPDRRGVTPLMAAAASLADEGHEPLVQALLQAGADRTARDRSGKTAADHARAAKRKALAALLQPA